MIMEQWPASISFDGNRSARHFRDRTINADFKLSLGFMPLPAILFTKDKWSTSESCWKVFRFQ